MVYISDVYILAHIYGLSREICGAVRIRRRLGRGRTAKCVQICKKASPCRALRGKGRRHLRQQMAEGMGQGQRAPKCTMYCVQNPLSRRCCMAAEPLRGLRSGRWGAAAPARRQMSRCAFQTRLRRASGRFYSRCCGMFPAAESQASGAGRRLCRSAWLRRRRLCGRPVF